MWSPRDEWFLKDTHTEQVQIYTAGIEKLAEVVGKRWWKKGNILNGVTPCLTRPYYIE
jgi:hypothetical protein